MFKFLIAVVLIVGLVSCEKKPSGRVFFVSPQNGEEVRSPVAFKMGLEGMEITLEVEEVVKIRSS